MIITTKREFEDRVNREVSRRMDEFYRQRWQEDEARELNRRLAKIEEKLGMVPGYLTCGPITGSQIE